MSKFLVFSIVFSGLTAFAEVYGDNGCIPTYYTRVGQEIYIQSVGNGGNEVDGGSDDRSAEIYEAYGSSTRDGGARMIDGGNSIDYRLLPEYCKYVR